MIRIVIGKGLKPLVAMLCISSISWIIAYAGVADRVKSTSKPHPLSKFTAIPRLHYKKLTSFSNIIPTLKSELTSTKAIANIKKEEIWGEVIEPTPFQNIPTVAAVKVEKKEIEEVREKPPVIAKEESGIFSFFTSKRKKRNRKITIVVDAGHGGHDPGAIGWDGIREKDVTLKIANKLKDRLHNNYFKVFLTRDDDRFISLRRRVLKTRDMKADLFISLHADASESDMARGLSIYTISNNASDSEAQKIMDRENNVEMNSVGIAEIEDSAADFVLSLTKSESQKRSKIFAKYVINHMQKNDVTVRKSPIKSAGFAVLKGIERPSVLIELGYITNKSDAINLWSDKISKRISSSIADAVDKFFEDHPM